MAFHYERVAGYHAMIDSLSSNEAHLLTLFKAFINQSQAMSQDLQQLGSAWGWDGEQVDDRSNYGLAWSVVKAVFSSNMPSYPLDRCRSGENALLIGYHSIERTEGLAEPVQLLINRQKRELITARDWITRFENLAVPQSRPRQPAAVL